MDSSIQSMAVSTKSSSGGTRRIWTYQEESVLIDALKEVVIAGMRSEQGFKPGHLAMLEKSILTAMPATDLRARPHIDSKLGTWRRMFNALYPIVDGTGNIWNTEINYLEISDEDWAALCKKEKTLKQIKGKFVPWLADWYEIFSRDRANGKLSENFQQAYKAISNAARGQPSEAEPESQSSSHMSNATKERAPVEGENNPKKASCSGESKKRKSLPNGEIEIEILGMMKAALAEASQTFQTAAKNLGHGFDVSGARKEIFNALDELPGLSLGEKVHLGLRFAKEPSLLDYFFSLKTEARLETVQQMLAEKK